MSFSDANRVYLYLKDTEKTQTNFYNGECRVYECITYCKVRMHML